MKRIPVGQLALHQVLGGTLPPPSIHSYIVSGNRRTVVDADVVEEYYYPQYGTDGTLLGNLRFALKYEPMDLGIIHDTLKAIGNSELEAWIRSEPTGGYSRTTWFLYETLLGKTLDLDNARSGNYIDALDPKKHFVSEPRNSPRHRVRDNLLGTPDLCPTVRRTDIINKMIDARLAEEARHLGSKFPTETLIRAVNYLYKKETRSSFAIEGETPTADREERFLRALHDVTTFDYKSKAEFVALQGQIVDRRFAADDWRDFQNFVGETTRRYGEYVHFICPKPQDVPRLMNGWMRMTERLVVSQLDAVISAALSAFAFVFIHPFEDGNGRIHRFLIHYILTKCGFTPPGLIFPVSSAILRERHRYDSALEAFSKPIMSGIDWQFENGALKVNNDTYHLYRFYDATKQVEYLFDRVMETVRVDFKEELEFLNVYDRALSEVKSRIDMPDRRASLLAKLYLQNGGKLSENKRSQFPELTDEEVFQIQDAILAIIAEHGAPPADLDQN